MRVCVVFIKKQNCNQQMRNEKTCKQIIGQAWIHLNTSATSSKNRYQTWDFSASKKKKHNKVLFPARLIDNCKYNLLSVTVQTVLISSIIFSNKYKVFSVLDGGYHDSGSKTPFLMYKNQNRYKTILLVARTGNIYIDICKAKGA